MKILFCNYEYPPLGGGGGVINALLAQELSKRHEVTVLTSQGRNLPRESIENGVCVIRAPVFFRRGQAAANLQSMFAFMFTAVLVGREHLRENRYDLINTHFVLPSGPVGATLARYAGVPNIISMHGGDLYDPSKFTSPHRNLLLRIWIKNLLRDADAVIGQSRNTLENMRRFYTPEIEGILIPLGIQRPDGNVASRKAFGFSEDDVLLVTVGRLIRRKAVSQLLSMMEMLHTEKVRLIIIGSGPEQQVLKEEALRRGLRNRALFLGYVRESEKFSILNMCDIYVSTSQHEGFCLAYLEAMTGGLPIVCYDNGGHTDYFKDQENGFLVPLNDLERFIEKTKLLINNPHRREVIGKNNQHLIEEYYIDKCARKYENIFNQVLAANPNEEKAPSIRPPTVSSE